MTYKWVYIFLLPIILYNIYMLYKIQVIESIQLEIVHQIILTASNIFTIRTKIIYYF